MPADTKSSGTGTIVARKRFAAADQRRFAALSGDVNPLHLDPLAARRTPFGQPMVHGMHVVLWSLDALCAAGYVGMVGGLTAKFIRPCPVGDELVLVRTSVPPAEISAEVRVGDTVCVTLTLSRAAPSVPPAAGNEPLAPLRDPPSVPRLIDIADIAGRAGQFRLPDSRVSDAFPAAGARLGEPVLRGLAALSAVIGMECPGRHSLFAAAMAAFTGQAGDTAHYRVLRVSAAVRQAVLRVQAAGVDAVIRAGVLPPPAVQPRFATVGALVRPGEFGRARALIVGGSRGLGEATAKLIAAGGGRTVVTYARGRTDAAAVAGEIVAGGGRCEIAHLDVLDDAAAQVAMLPLQPTSLYYFATGPIAGHHDHAGAARAAFERYYLQGFAELVRTLAAAAERRLIAFYPSTVFIANPPPPFAAYAAAKAAGEALCTELGQSLPNLRILVRRLPRVATDQTLSLMPLQTAGAIDIMLPIVREIEALAG